ncbi:hypothetical protein F4678DRAFT_486402 [Xylaria arbuscula]|nr:hypothetical protein F4678DRAFT_486402 [Xylaria arbuscula]
MDENIDYFTVVTGVSRDVARRYLEISGGDPSQAIQLFFENPELQSSFGAASTEATASAASAHHQDPSSRARGSSSGRTGPADSRDIIEIESDDDDDDIRMIDEDGDDEDVVAVARNAQEEEDAAMARRLQEELYGSGSGAPDDGVRAPIAQTTETLAGPVLSWGGVDVDPIEQLSSRQARQRRQRNTGNPFDQGPSIWDDASAAPLLPDTRPDQALSRAALLRDLFRPPHDLLSDATWDEARDEGKEEKKWIMVNLQDLEIFQCQVLNRDVWKDERIKALVKEHFIFLQYDKNELRAQSYTQLYLPNGAHENSDNFPHVSIIDPRTGEQVKVWSGTPFPTANELYGDLIEFLDRYSLAANSKNPVVQSKPKRQQVDIGRLTEDEMLRLALQNSLENQDGSSGPNVQDPDMLTRSNDDSGKGKGKETSEVVDLTSDAIQLPEGSVNPAELAFSEIASTNSHVEPENNPATTTRIQFRHPTGRIIRRFAVADPVRRIYEWLKAEPFEGKEGVMFELKTMPAGADLIDDLDRSIEEAGLKQGTVMIEFIED